MERFYFDTGGGEQPLSRTPSSEFFRPAGDGPQFRFPPVSRINRW
jgi:hypothetical protein